MPHCDKHAALSYCKLLLDLSAPKAFAGVNLAFSPLSSALDLFVKKAFPSFSRKSLKSEHRRLIRTW
jgi:hypothetical protein